MHIEITDKTTLREIQDVFSKFYPFLKIAFFSKRHAKYMPSDERNEIEPNILIGDIKATHVSGMIEILPSYKVFEVEKEFTMRFGLSIQILLKMQNGWEQTTGMDDFTLKELSEIGRNSQDEALINDEEDGFSEEEEKPQKLY